MDTAVRPVLEQLKFQVALVKADLLFEACDKLAEEDRHVLYEEIRQRLLERTVSTEAPTNDKATDPTTAMQPLEESRQDRALSAAGEEELPVPAFIRVAITRLLMSQSNRDAVLAPAAPCR